MSNIFINLKRKIKDIKKTFLLSLETSDTYNIQVDLAILLVKQCDQKYLGLEEKVSTNYRNYQ